MSFEDLEEAKRAAIDHVIDGDVTDEFPSKLQRSLNSGRCR
jgi:hypothetical protein